MSFSIKRLKELDAAYADTFRKANQIGGPTDHTARYSLEHTHSVYAAELPKLLVWVERASDLFGWMKYPRCFCTAIPGTCAACEAKKLLAEIES